MGAMASEITSLTIVYSTVYLPLTSEFPAQMASSEENVSIWWHHHVTFGKFRGLPAPAGSFQLFAF